MYFHIESILKWEGLYTKPLERFTRIKRDVKEHDPCIYNGITPHGMFVNVYKLFINKKIPFRYRVVGDNSNDILGVIESTPDLWGWGVLFWQSVITRLHKFFKRKCRAFAIL